MHLVTPEAMREMDRRTIEDVGISGPILMDRAAHGAVEALLEYFTLTSGASIGLICGTGNNGGDGLAMATMLAHRGYEPHVVVLGSQDKLSDDARLYFDIATETVEFLDIADDHESLRRWLNDAPSCELWCDAIFGTGLDRPVEGRFARAIEFLRHQSTPILAVDVPSGLDAHRGQIMGTVASADLTTTFGFAKVGQCLDPARSHCGRLVVVDIGIPYQIRDEVGIEAVGLDRWWLTEYLPLRHLDIHKGAAGRTLHVGGRPSTAGAIALSARAALVGGAGLITVATDRRSQLMIPTMTPEIMARGVFESTVDSIDEASLIALVDDADTIVVGPGLGTDATARKVFEIVLANSPSQLIIDADGLNLAAADAEIGATLTSLGRSASVVLTPHPGEMARLLDTEIAEILDDSPAAARKLAAKFNATVVLKTAATVIAAPDGRLAINRTGNPGMATGGMGDALTGLIASAFADFEGEPYSASCCGVVVHGLAGDAGRRFTGARGLTVRRLLDEVPTVWQSLQ